MIPALEWTSLQGTTDSSSKYADNRLIAICLAYFIGVNVTNYSVDFHQQLQK